MFVFCLVLCAAIFLATFHERAYNSDDVLLHNALLYWRPFHHQIFYSDAGTTYLVKLPLYWLISLVMAPGRGALMVAGLLFTLANFTVIYFSTVYLLRRAKLPVTWPVLAPFAWMASFGYAVTSQFAAASLHNVEIGAIFLTTAILVKIYSDRVSFTRSLGSLAWAAAFACFMGLMVANDHYYLFICTLPAFAFVVGTGLLQLAAKRQSVQIFLLLAASLVVAKVFDVIATKAGIVLLSGFAGATTPQFIGFDGLLTNIIVALHSLLIIFGADFWGRPVSQALVYVCLANAVLLTVIVVYGFRLSKTLAARLKMHKPTPLKLSVPTMFWAVMACAFLLYIVTTQSVQSTSTYHYLMVVPFFAVPLLCWLCATHKVNWYLYAALGVAVLLNTGSAVLGVRKPELINEPYSVAAAAANDQTINTRLIAFLNANGLTKGFGGYADANINSYLSKGAIDIMPTLCAANGPQLFRFSFTASQLTKPAAKTFYLYNPTASPFPAGCTAAQAAALFGKPVQTLQSQGDTILVYSYDISSKLPG